MAFNPDEYLAEKAASQPFNPDQYLAEKSAVALPTDAISTSAPKAAASGIIQGSTLGLGDELGALGSTAMNAVSGFSGPLAGGSIGDLFDEYHDRRNKLRAEFEAAHKAHPKTYLAGELAGGIASGSGLSSPKNFSQALETGAAIGAGAGFGNSTANNLDDVVDDTLTGAGTGLLTGGLGYGAGKVIQKVVPGLNSFAEGQAVKATGATGKQAEKFAPGAGRELLDRGIVGFGDDASNIAGKAEDALDVSRDKILGSLNELDSRGGAVSRDSVVTQLESHINELRSDPSQNEVVRKLESILESVKNSPENVSLSAAEKTKRGFQDLSNYNDPVSTRANKVAANIYRNSVEDSAQELNPELAADFQEGKSTYGILSPIREAAAKRAATTSQSPLGGLADITAAGAGLMKAGPVGAIAAPLARRFIAPRISSSLAVGADKLVDVLASAPETFGKYAPVLQAAAQRGGNSLAVTHFILQQQDPEYREQVKQSLGNE